MIGMLTMPCRRIVQISLIIIFILSGCAGLDDYLEIPLEEQEPMVLFHCDAYRADSNSLVLIGIENPDVYKGLQSISLRFYLKNENEALSIIHGSSKKLSSFLPFTRLNGEAAAHVDQDFPELKELAVFGLFLQGMKVDENQLQSYTALEDATYRNITIRNAEMISDRELRFIIRELDRQQSPYYKKLIANTFSLKP